MKSIYRNRKRWTLSPFGRKKKKKTEKDRSTPLALPFILLFSYTNTRWISSLIGDTVVKRSIYPMLNKTEVKPSALRGLVSSFLSSFVPPPPCVPFPPPLSRPFLCLLNSVPLQQRYKKKYFKHDLFFQPRTPPQTSQLSILLTFVHA